MVVKIVISWGTKDKVCQHVTVCRHIAVVSAVGRVREPPASATNVSVHEVFLHPADAAHVQVTEKAIPRRAPLSLQPRALRLSVQDARAHVMCWHRLTKICWQRLAGHCVALLMLRQCRQPKLRGRSVLIQSPQRLEALGPQPTSGACSRAAFSSRP